MNTKDIQCRDDWRYLGLTESIVTTLNHYKEPIFLDYAVDVISSSQKIPDEIIKKAMLILSSQHIFLHSKISKDENGDLLFQPLPCNPTSTTDWLPIKFLNIEKKGDWIQQIPGMTKSRFTEDEPLWRMLWCTVPENEQNETEIIQIDKKFTYVLILCEHHSISDGKSNFDLICNQFLSILNRLLMKKDLSDLTKPVRLAKSLESIFLDVDTPISKCADDLYDKEVENKILNHMRFGKPYNQTIMGLRSNDSYHENEREHIHPFIISEELTQAVIKFSKTVKLSVTSIVSSFMLVAMKEVERKRGKEFDGYKLELVLDFRKFNSMLTTLPMPLGLYVCTIIEDYIKAPENEELNDILKTATNIQELIKDKNKMSAVTKESHFKKNLPLYSSRTSVDVRDRFLSLGLTEKMIVSGIGLCQQQNDDFTKIADIDEHHRFSDNTLTSLNFLFHTFKGKMTFCLVCDYHWLDINYLKDLDHSFVGVLERMCHTIPTN